MLSRSLEVWLEKKREERREEGRAEVRAEWNAWLARMREAQAKGEPFDEPTPSERGVQPSDFRRYRSFRERRPIVRKE